MELQDHVALKVEEMFADAKEAGYELYFNSGYRSYKYQESIFSRRVKKYGFEEATKIIAIPGQSEHQTGLALDVTCEAISYDLNRTFENTNEFQWLINNCYKYGFILRYRKDKEDITKYVYEPWHYRYIGDVNIAKEIMDKGLVLEEYLNK
jgi:D-alanyl-D-alanine carboxypeptidase